MDLVREVTSPLWTFVLVIERLQVPPSCARAFDMPLRLLSLPLSLVWLVFLVPPAALPPLPMVDEVPVGPVDVPPVPRLDAEVPPTAALPAVPPVAAEPLALVDEPPEPIVDALCASVAVATLAPRSAPSAMDVSLEVMSLDGMAIPYLFGVT
jgi:hypothetical protein